MKGEMSTLLVVALLAFGLLTHGLVVFEMETERDTITGLEELSGDTEDKDKSIDFSSIGGFFTENIGQMNENDGLFHTIGNPLSVAFGTSWVAYYLLGQEGESNGMGDTFYMRFEGANSVEPTGVTPLRSRYNYFIGDNPEDWVSGARNYQEVIYESLWDNIDVRFYFQDGMLKYEFMVMPGGDPSHIELRYSDTIDLFIEKITGDLLLVSSIGTIRDHAPFSYQIIDDNQIEISTIFHLITKRVVAFSIDQYDYQHPLIIDPGLIFSTYIGGSEDESGIDLALDDSGNIYACGQTKSLNFPTSLGAYDPNSNGLNDIFILKLDSSGSSLKYATYIGGSNRDYGLDLCVDDSGNVFVVGATSSTDFPVTDNASDSTHNGGQDAYIIKINSTGSSLLYSSYIGGNGSDAGYRICMDDSGRLYISGGTFSIDFPTTIDAYDTTHNGSKDIFVLKLNATDYSVEYSTYIGGNAADNVCDICIDKNQTVYLNGYTQSGDYPIVTGSYDINFNGGVDAFVTKMNLSDSSLIYSSYIGGGNDDRSYDSTIDNFGNVFLIGRTTSIKFPTTIGTIDTSHNGGNDVFLLKLNETGSSLEYSTFIGTDSSDVGYGIDIDDKGCAYITGMTAGSSFPTTPGAYDATFNGVEDLFIAKVNPNGSYLLYSTFVGGGSSEWGMHIAVNDIGFVNIIGDTESTNFPVTTKAYDTTHNRNEDVFILRLKIGELNGTAPSPPQNVTAVAGDRSVELIWDPPRDSGGLFLESYRIYYGSTEDNLSFLWFVDSLTESYIHQPLRNGETHYYAITALNYFRESNLSTIVNATPMGLPREPANLTATPNLLSVLLQWNEPIETGGSSILGYRLYRGNQLDSIAHLIDLDNVTEYLDETVEKGQIYYYKILAFNIFGNGTASSIVSAIPYGLPDSPLGLKAITNDGEIALTWRVPLNDGGREVTGYNVYRGHSETTLTQYDKVDDLPSYLDRGVVNGRTYFYAVAAVNEVGESPLSYAVNATPLGTPGMPLNLTLAAGDGSVTLSWDPPYSDGGSSLLGYNVYKGGDETTLFRISTVREGTTYPDKGLQNGQTWYYRIRAYNTLGEGPPSEVLSATPLAPPRAPGDLIVTEHVGQLELRWTRPPDNGGSPITRYRIYRGETPQSLGLLKEIGPSTFRYFDTDVVTGRPYHYQVRAVTEAGEGPGSSITEGVAFGPPGVPQGLVASPGDGRVSLKWDAPDEDGGRPVTGYKLLRGPDPGSMTLLTEVGDTTSYMDIEVTNGVAYHYSISAVNEAGEGTRTETVEVTPMAMIELPGAPASLRGEGKGGKVVLMWTPPVADGGSPVTGYVVLRGASPDDLRVLTETGLVLSYTDEEVERGVTYYYSVAAMNEAGRGEAAQVLEVEVKKKAEGGPGFSVLAVVMAITIIALILMQLQRGRIMFY